MATSSIDREAERDVGMNALIRAHDWASTPLGPMESWPAALRLALNIAEHSAFPTAIYWGPEFHLLYNDAWAPIPAERHPWALGKPAEEVWSDIWPVVGPQFRQVIETGQGMSHSAQMLPMVRGGIACETYWNYSLTAIVDEAGQTVGLFNQGNEVTDAVINERRLSFQIRLADRLRDLVTPAEVKREAAALLGEHLGAARVGFSEVDEERGTATISSEWTPEPDGPGLTGRSTSLSDLSPNAINHLRRGEALTIADVGAMGRDGGETEGGGGMLPGVQAAITVPLVRCGVLKAMLYVHEPEARQWKPSEAALARDVAERAWAAVEQAEAEQRLRDSEDHYRHAVELNPQVSWTATPDGQLNRVARRWHDWTGTTGLGETWALGLHPDDRQPSFEAWARSLSTGDAYDIEHRVRNRDGSYRWARSRAFPRHADDGSICLWYGATEDIHERKAGEERQRLLINELNHRVKNTLATVQAIAFQTLKGDIPLAEARARFEARLLALSNAHNLLTDQNWEGAPLDRIVADATAPLAGEGSRFDVEGELLWMSPRPALALALALHELSTNAVKYGALSNETGRVSIVWTADKDLLRLEWKESGGPEVRAPERRGFGSRLVEKGLTADLGGTAVLHFDCDGVRCVIEASLRAIQFKEAEIG